MTSDARPVTPLEVQANRFQLVSRLADDLAHEIKNPLHAMIINLELVKRRAQAGDVATVVQRAESAAADVMRVNALIEQLLELLRPAPRDKPVTDVDVLVEEMLPLLIQQARLSRVELVYDALGAPVPAPIGRHALKLVLLNLVANALARVRVGGGRVLVSARHDAAGVHVLVRESPAGGAGQATARPAASAGEVDEAELGMAVARHLVEKAGGTLRVERGDAGEVDAVSLPPESHA